ncbi:MAG: nucleotidyl transferase AbiEii/AbiGii toxin family protein [Elusimicrobiota bacterium]
MIAKNLLFRGGTALYKLYYKNPVRYSEDIDLVQKEACPIGNVMGEIRRICDPLLGKSNWKQSKGKVTFYYRTQSEIPPVVPLKFKIEINTREHFAALGQRREDFSVDCRWFLGKCKVSTYSLEELLGTKMRALYQRRKGRDLFDLWYGIKYGKIKIKNVVNCFKEYMNFQKVSVSKRDYLNNLKEKIADPEFRKDTDLLLSPGIGYSPDAGYKIFSQKLEDCSNSFQV